MEKLLITGLWLIFHRYYSNLGLTHSVVMVGKIWILKKPLFKMAKSPNPSQLTIDIVTSKLAAKHDYIAITQDSLLRFYYCILQGNPP